MKSLLEVTSLVYRAVPGQTASHAGHGSHAFRGWMGQRRLNQAVV